MKILIVDDEIHIRELIAKYAKHENIETDQAENGLDAISKVKEEQFDLVLMDIMMPELDGFSSVKEIRKFSDVPVIMLSARSEEYDKLYGFDLGIDDYVTKPFSPKELFRRIKAVVNRYLLPRMKVLEETVARKNILEFDGLKIDLDAYLVYVDDVACDLTKKEYELLLCLCQNAMIAVKREQLLASVWGDDFDGDDRTLDTHIKSLRKKIGLYGDCISTIRRVGYRFDAPNK